MPPVSNAPQRKQSTSRYDAGRQAIYLCEAVRVPVFVHLSLFLVALLQMVAAILNFGILEGIVFGIIATLALFTTILVHELGHVTACRRVGGDAEEIILWMFGGLAKVQLDPASATWLNQCFVAVAGPLTHLPMMLGWWLFANFLSDQSMSIFFFSDSDGIWAYLLWWGFYMNLSLLCFNLFLPVYPLDGGQIFAHLLQRCFAPEQAAKGMIGISGLMATLLLVFGLWSVQPLWTIMGIWVGYQNYLLYKMLAAGQLHSHPLFAEASMAHTTNAGGTRGPHTKFTDSVNVLGHGEAGIAPAARPVGAANQV